MSTTNCHQPIVTNQLSPTNCQQPIATNQLSPTNCHPPIVTNQLSSTNCQPTVTNQLPVVVDKLSPTNCHQPIATHQLLPTNCHQLSVTNQLSLTNCPPANCLLQQFGCTPWCWLVLDGACGSPPLRRCDLRANRLLHRSESLPLPPPDRFSYTHLFTYARGHDNP